MENLQEPHDELTLTILLIEDNAMDATLVQEMLKQPSMREGEGIVYKFYHASSLAAAEPYWKGPLDLVLLDLSLPDSHGLATFVRVEALAKHTPIVILSGLNDDAVAFEAVRQGAQDYLVKWQMGSRTLSRVLRYAVERKKGEDEIRQVNDELEKQFSAHAIVLEDARQRLQESETYAAVAQLAAEVAQELNNPLSMILSFTQSLIQHPDSEDLPQVLRSIEREAIRCRALAKNFMSLARGSKANGMPPDAYPSAASAAGAKR